MFIGNDAKSVLLIGINKVADFVATTMGPGGKFINIKEHTNNHITKDGVTVAKKFWLENPAEQVGADFIIEAAKRTLIEAGDGTTTTTVMARSMMLEGHQRLALKKLNTGRIAKEMVHFSELAIRAITAQAVEVELSDERSLKLLKQVGTISANGDEQMAEMCLQAIKAVGPEPSSVVFVEAEFDEEDTISFSDGIVLESRVNSSILGSYSRRTLTSPSDKAGVAVFIVPSVSGELPLIGELATLLDAYTKQGMAVLLICKEPANNLKTRISNATFKNNIAFISPNLFGNKYVQLCEDLKILTGAQCINLDRESDSELPDVFVGFCDKVEITSGNMTLIKPDRQNSPEHEKLVKDVEDMLTRESNKIAREYLKDRLARITTGVATIRITASADSNLAERKDRYDDCVRAICTTIKTGAVRGGGASFLSAAYQLLAEEVDPLDQERKIARDLIESALVTPFNTITTNALNYIPKINGRRLVNEVNLTVDVWSGEMIDAFEYGILDPLGVQVAALRSAVNASTVFLNTGGMYQSRPSSF